MTVLLTPVETIFDDLTIIDLEKHWHEDPMCMKGDAPATVRLISKCCHFPTLQCDTHHKTEREGFERRVAAHGARCKNCRQDFTAPATWDDFMEEVPL